MKRLLLILIAILIIVLGFWWWQSGQTNVADNAPSVSRSFFPQAGSVVSDLVGSLTDRLDGNSREEGNGIGGEGAAIQVVVDEPIADFDFVTVGTSSVLIYVERGTGHIYRLDQSTKDKVRLSAATFSPVWAAAWAQDAAKTYFFIQTSQGGNSSWYRIALTNRELVATSTQVTTNAIRLAGTIEDIIPAPDHKTIFTLETNRDKALGYTSKPDGANRTLVWSSNYPDWRVWWPTANYLYLATKADSTMPSVAERLNLTTKIAERLLEGSSGLSLMPEQGGERAIYSVTRFGSFSTYWLNPTDNKSLILPIITQPEKCVWPKGEIIWCFVPSSVPNSNYPESWYQGLVSFADQLRHINITNNQSQLVVDPATLNLTIDALSPKLDQVKNYLYFINKGDGRLWRANVQSVF